MLHVLYDCHRHVLYSQPRKAYDTDIVCFPNHASGSTGTEYVTNWRIPEDAIVITSSDDEAALEQQLIADGCARKKITSRNSLLSAVGRLKLKHSAAATTPAVWCSMQRNYEQYFVEAWLNGLQVNHNKSLEKV